MKKISKTAPVRTVRVKKIDASVKPVVKLQAEVKKTVFVRQNMSDGYYSVTYYYTKGPYGELIAEDLNLADFYERVIYDSAGNPLGSSIGKCRRAYEAEK
ncbi:MAG: hypothetical protein LBL82_01920 [Oscillospiraceae bacterium]|jgi:hypothetical protein|nr:hypothetical protein [Oscillospiraceae bacterium]